MEIIICPAEFSVFLYVSCGLFEWSGRVTSQSTDSSSGWLEKRFFPARDGRYSPLVHMFMYSGNFQLFLHLGGKLLLSICIHLCSLFSCMQSVRDINPLQGHTALWMFFHIRSFNCLPRCASNQTWQQAVRIHTPKQQCSSKDNHGNPKTESLKSWAQRSHLLGDHNPLHSHTSWQ